MDGNTDDNYFADSCTSTNGQAWPWWAVDLGAVTAVKSVMITNRGDCCCKLSAGEMQFLCSSSITHMRNPI